MNKLFSSQSIFLIAAALLLSSEMLFSAVKPRIASISFREESGAPYSFPDYDPFWDVHATGWGVPNTVTFSINIPLDASVNVSDIAFLITLRSPFLQSPFSQNFPRLTLTNAATGAPVSPGLPNSWIVTSSSSNSCTFKAELDQSAQNGRMEWSVLNDILTINGSFYLLDAVAPLSGGGGIPEPVHIFTQGVFTAYPKNGYPGLSVKVTDSKRDTAIAYVEFSKGTVSTEDTTGIVEMPDPLGNRGFPMVVPTGKATVTGRGTTESGSLIPTIDIAALRIGPDARANVGSGKTDVDEKIVPVGVPGVLSTQPEAHGVVADGVTPLLFKIETDRSADKDITGSVTLTVDPLSGEATGLVGRLHVLSAYGGWSRRGASRIVIPKGHREAYAYIEGIDSTDIHFSESSRAQLDVTLTITPDADLSAISTVHFGIRKPPVVLVHGYNSSSNAWSEVFKTIIANERGLDFVIPINYGKGAVSDLYGRLDELSHDLDAILRDQIEDPDSTNLNPALDGWAFTRYDVVGHSQGGVLLRMLCQQAVFGDHIQAPFAQSPFRSVGNSYRGRFRRIITIGSPQNGSLLEHYVWQLRGHAGLFFVAIEDLLVAYVGLIQPKFDPFGSQIREINNLSLQADSAAKFHAIATTIADGLAPSLSAKIPAYDTLGLCRAAPGDMQTRGQVLLPSGSDGVVGYESQIAGAPSTLLQGNIAHAPAPLLSFFGIEENSWQTASPTVATSVIGLLESTEGFGPFQIPQILGQEFHDRIDALVPSLTTDDIVALSYEPNARLAASGSLAKTAASSSAVYHYSLTPSVNLPIGGIVHWLAITYGPKGLSSEGVELQVDPTSSLGLTVSVDESVRGDVVLSAMYNTSEGNLVFAKPQLVVSKPFMAGLNGIALRPDVASLSEGDTVGLSIWGSYDNGQSSPIFISNRSSAEFTSSDPSVVEVNEFGVIEAVGPGNAIISCSHAGFTTSTQLSVKKVVAPSFYPFAGAYVGVSETVPASNDGAGMVRLQLRGSGRFSVAVILGGHRYAAKGRFSPDGRFSGSIIPKEQPGVLLSLRLDLVTGRGGINGSLSNEMRESRFVLERSAFNAKANRYAGAGQYAIMFELGDEMHGNPPAGTGYGMANISAAGRVNVVGVLADKTKIALGAYISESKSCAFYKPMYHGKGSLSGVAAAGGVAGIENISGTLFWFNPGKRNSTEGFDATLRMIAQRNHTLTSPE